MATPFISDGNIADLLSSGDSGATLLLYLQLPDAFRGQVEASGGADALESAADAFDDPSTSEMIPKAEIIAALRAFAQKMTAAAGPLSRGALAAAVEETDECTPIPPMPDDWMPTRTDPIQTWLDRELGLPPDARLLFWRRLHGLDGGAS